MKLLEYEAKSLLKRAGISIPQHIVVQKTTNIESLVAPVVLKSQVPVGGRGKLGGVVILDTPSTLTQTVETLFDLVIKGYTPNVLLAEEKLAIAHEYYLCLLIDRNTSSIRLIAHKDGGVEVEDNASSDFYNKIVDDVSIHEHAMAVAGFLDIPTVQITPLILNLYDAFKQNDAMLLEINPLVITSDNELVAGDCKMELDDAARFRHHDWQQFEDTPTNTNFVILDENGSIATIANGAGLAMATVDAVVAKGLSPANFLDIGGGANVESVLEAFKKISNFPQVDAIVINIFAGITRCDEVAKAIIAAKDRLPHLPPLFIRLAGTHFEEAVALLTDADIPTLTTLDECLEAAKEVVYA